MTTKVIFRKAPAKDGKEIVAVFPTLPGTADPATFCVYAHFGQHGAAAQTWYEGTRPAKPDEYADLQAELVDIGYEDLVIAKRMTYKDFLTRDKHLTWNVNESSF